MLTTVNNDPSGAPSCGVSRPNRSDGAEVLTLGRSLGLHPGVAENHAGHRPHEHGAHRQGQGQADQEGDRRTGSRSPAPTGTAA